MTSVKAPNAEPIPGYRLLEPLGRGGFGEVWKCEAPGGLFKAIKFVDGHADSLDSAPTAADEEWQAIERIKAIRHPFLLSMERVERVGRALVIVMELADTNLHHVLEGHQRAGLVGVPRGELLAYLAEAAEVLDLLNTRHGLQHLDVKPKNLFVVSNHVKVADFGLVSGLGRFQGGELPLGAITPLYASPEVFQGGISPHSDQYSLAIVYHELLTGTLPFDGKNARQLLLQHTTATPNLLRLPPGDLVIVARALSKAPEERFPSCLEFVRALAKAGKGSADVAVVRPMTSPAPPTPPVQATRPANGDGGRRQPAPYGSDMLPGHRFVKCVERGPLTEVWQVEGPGGRPRLVKFVYGFDQRRAVCQREAVARLREMRHPALVPTEVRDDGPGRLALVTDLPPRTLRERWQECRGEGSSGLPREEALRHVAAAAKALDALHEAFGLPHLALNPRPLWLDGDRLLVADFGLVPLFWLPAGRSAAQFNPRYAAPELLRKQAGRAADQYSLAVIYHEMVSGALPQRGSPSPSRFGRSRPSQAVTFEAVSDAEADVLIRALNDDPARRFSSCAEFAQTLADAARR